MGEALDGPAAAALHEIRARLRAVRERWRSVELAENALFWLAALAAVTLAVALVQLATRPAPGSWARLALLGALALTAALAVARGLVVPLMRSARDEAVARRVERAFPALQNALINAIELAVDARVPSKALAEAAIVQSRDRARQFRLEDAVCTDRLRRLAAWAAGACGALVLAFAVYGGPVASALAQVLMPFTFVPAKGSVTIVDVRPGDAKVRAGASVAAEVEIAPTGGRPPAGRMFYICAGGPEVQRPLAVTGRTRYGFALPVAGPTDYRVEIGGTQSRVYRLEVIERPAVERVDIQLRFPDYAGREPASRERAVDEALDLRVPAGTAAAFAVTANRKGVAVFLDLADGGKTESVRLEGSASSLVAHGTLRLTEPGERRYSIRLADEAAGPGDPPVWHALVALPDGPPTASFIAPARGLDLPPGGATTLVVRAADDYGLRRVEVRCRRNREGEDLALCAWEGDRLGPGRRTEAALTHAWRLDPSTFAPGDVVTYWAVASDRLPGRAGESARWEIRVVAPSEAAGAKQDVLAELLRAVEEIAALQEAAQEDSRALAGRGAVGVAWRPALDAQSRGRETTVRAVDAAKSDDADVALVRAVLRALASGEMSRAVVLAERLTAGAAGAAPGALDESQTRILAQLRKLVGVLPRAIEEAKKDELARDEPSDLPGETAQRLRELADQLKAFADEQRKVISTTEDIAKVPVEDFTDEDRARQDALAAIEEKWEKFMKDAHSDLSKLPPQDFSSEQLLKELVETYCEVEMAKDALTKESVTIAVPAEQAGLELAEELTTHIEKWLPDSPDREKWSMEEALGEYETPMAELPGELEDLVGELMEDEEDIFDEMEDVSSSYMDSLDKGAGWDAVDGPISNMSAQGVTGNHLPNSSEIGGRSGEGRTGRASGEMVEDSATGKGGRRTPTRLTPDAFLGGEIKDTSTDPAGGSTGGGKVSGAGEVGLEGPVPPDIGREMERLRGAQATLRNRAERVAMDLRARNFPETDIDVTLRQMRAFEADLKDGRYENIAHRRDVVLDGIARSREFVEGTARVELDRSKGPEGFDEEVGSALDEVDPEGFEALLRAYREAIRSGRAP